MRVHDSVAFVTGANRGLGLIFAKDAMAGELTFAKVKPVDMLRRVLSAIEAGRDEALVDELSRAVKARQGMIPDLGQAWRSAISTLLSGDLP
jgi:NAD(P)-dependent dehydrogenase (short-subunit alcohol dehydrogenase family)